MTSGVAYSPKFCVECYTFGLISSGLILIAGPPGSGKTSLAKAFMRLALQNGQPLLVLSTQTSVSDLMTVAESMSERFGGTTKVVDCYALPQNKTAADATTSLDLASIGKVLSESLGKLTRCYVIFDSLDGVALGAGEGAALQFLLTCLRTIEGSKATGVATVTTGIHSDKFNAMARTYFKGVMELKLEEREGGLARYIRIYSLKGTSHRTDWLEFAITDEGIRVGSEDERAKLPPRHSQLHFLRFTDEYQEPAAEQRKLSAIMFTDIAGFTALTQNDEQSALRMLENHRKLLRQIFGAHHGREIKTIGDAFLVEFDSALAATRCALVIQERLKVVNAKRKRSQQIKLRIGIHVGDVIQKGGDIYGDAVNIASRISPLAPPAGICVTQQVYDQVHNKMTNRFERLESASLKNVKSKIPVYRLSVSRSR